MTGLKIREVKLTYDFLNLLERVNGHQLATGTLQGLLLLLKFEASKMIRTIASETSKLFGITNLTLARAVAECLPMLSLDEYLSLSVALLFSL